MSLFISDKFVIFLLFVFAFPIARTFPPCADLSNSEENNTQELVSETIVGCSEDEFECRNRVCIPIELLCDGRADCSDQSDETRTECTRAELSCPQWSFRCDYGACVHLEAKCDGVQNCVDNSDELLDDCPRPPPLRQKSWHRRPYNSQVTPGVERPPIKEELFTPPRSSFGSPISLNAGCLVPHQPINGRWKLHRSFCREDNDCDIPQRVALQTGSRLIYSCAKGYKARGNTDVYCRNGGNWTSIPICVASLCTQLDSISRAASCSRFGHRISCQNPVLPYTRAKITCRYNYGPDGTPYYEQEVECTPKGRWHPEPMRCIPVCGFAKNFKEETNSGAFPWYASVWEDISPPQNRMEFKCSATIIDRDIVVTAAHCVLNNETGLTYDPEVLRVTAMTSYGIEGLEERNPWAILKVKEVFTYCESLKLAKGYSSDIALIRLTNPLEFSRVFLPACLDVSSLSDRLYPPGANGTIAGFGSTSVLRPSRVLLTPKVIHVLDVDCGNPFHVSGGGYYVNGDELCVVYSNETQVCDWDSGGGLFVKTGNLWHVRGVFSIGLTSHAPNASEQCGTNPYSIYTKTSTYMPWIQEIFFKLQRHETFSPCNNQTSLPLMDPSPTSTVNVTPRWASTLDQTPTAIPDVTLRSISTSDLTLSATMSAAAMELPTTPTTPSDSDVTLRQNETVARCSVPPQPANGEWKLDADRCGGNVSCALPEIAMVEPGDQLIYSCAPGFKIEGSPNVFCSSKGRWSHVPTCVEITCNSLESVSRSAYCTQSTIYTPCNSSALIGTKADLICRLGYRTDGSIRGSKTVYCSGNGTWEPTPITCNPNCGKPNLVKFSPQISNGVRPNIAEFPWHASLYKQENFSSNFKEFLCGATIIQTNLVLTAAHCVFDESIMKIDIPEKFYVASGNIFRDFDSELHDSQIVQKSIVKNIYHPCEYTGFRGKYGSDIALLQLREPFQLSEILMPICIEALGESDSRFEEGSVGKIAGFGVTATGENSAVLQMTNVTSVTSKQCGSKYNISRSEINVDFITTDKLCGESENGTNACRGDSGGGLVVERAGSWILVGVLSINIVPNNTPNSKVVDGSCTGEIYTLYIKLSSQIPWIRNVLLALDRNQIYSGCP